MEFVNLLHYWNVYGFVTGIEILFMRVYLCVYVGGFQTVLFLSYGVHQLLALDCNPFSEGKTCRYSLVLVSPFRPNGIK